METRFMGNSYPYTREDAEMLRDAIYDMWISLAHKMTSSPGTVTAHEKAIFHRCSHILSELKYRHVVREPETDTIWRYDNESYCINALFKDRTVQMAGQAYHSPDIAERAAVDMANGYEFCPLNRNNILNFLICSRRERELFRVANKKDCQQ